MLRDARVNGLPVQVLELRSELPTEELLAYFKRDWRRYSSVAPLETEQQHWRKLTLQQGPVQVVVQIERDGRSGGSRALLSQMNFRDVQRDYIPRDLPSLAPLHVTQVSDTRDGPKRSRLVQMGGDASFEITQQRLRQYWSRAGWRAVFERSANEQRQWLASFDRGPASVDIVLTQAGPREPLALTINLLEVEP
ncbi:hypothetical protein ACG02S_01705 [Roseateles sp. DC23W]|uniref:Uncharacterized protein n=1 Tax=Pelomonas dachongensis TaxID=3299029 RepID=A0ABW7EHF5_9BURK